MASARKITPVPPPLTYVLELSAAEARALLTVLDCVGGSPNYSGRRHTDAVRSALLRSGAKGFPIGAASVFEHTSSSVYFRDGMGL